MAGTGSSYGLDKGFGVLTAYSGGTVNKFRLVKVSTAAAPAYGQVDLNVIGTTRSVGVVQEDVDAAKVTTGKAVVDVRLNGITKVFVAATGTVPVLGDRVISGTDGGVVLAAGAGNIPVGVVVGAPATVNNGDIVHVLLTPGAAGI